MRLLKNTFFHLKGKSGRLFLLFLFTGILQLATFFVEIALPNLWMHQFLISIIKLFFTAVCYVGIIRICFENRKMIASLVVDYQVILVIDALITVAILNYLPLLVPSTWIKMILLCLVGLLTVLLPALALKGYRNITAIKQAWHCIKTDYKQLWILFILQVVMTIFIMHSATLKIEFLKFATVIRIQGLQILSDVVFLESLVIKLFLPALLPIAVWMILQAFITTMSVKYVEYL